MAKFIVKGPIDIPTEKQRRGGRLIDEGGIDKLGKKHKELGKKGCYVFSLKAGRGSKPLYVGKASGQTIIKEAFNPRNKNNLNGKLNKQAGRLQIWTITPEAGRGGAPVNEIKEIEKEMIAVASIKNPELINIQNKAKKSNWAIKGVVQPKPGPRTAVEKGFRNMIGIGE